MAAMTQVKGSTTGGNKTDEVLGEIDSSGVSIGWNRGTLSEEAKTKLHEILERNGGAMDRSFDLQHGALLLMRCRLLPNGANGTQFSFDGSQRRR